MFTRFLCKQCNSYQHHTTTVGNTDHAKYSRPMADPRYFYVATVYMHTNVKYADSGQLLFVICAQHSAPIRARAAV